MMAIDVEVLCAFLSVYSIVLVTFISRVWCLPAETCFCQSCGLNRIKVVKTTTYGKKLDLPCLVMQTLCHTLDSLTGT